MNKKHKKEIAEKLQELVELFTHKRFEKISKAYPSEYNLTAEEIRNSIESYPNELITPPQEAFINFEFTEVKNSFPKSWDVRFSLWTIEEGVSDLTIVLDVKESAGKDYVIGLRDVLVP